MGKYKKFLSKELPTSKFETLVSIIDNHQLKALQTLLNIRGESLVEDGVMGFNTMMVIIKHKEELDEIFRDMISVVEPQTDKDKAILELTNFLQINEGVTCHYLKNEHGFTTPYGVYSVVNPKSKAVLYMSNLYEKYGLNEHKRLDAYKLDSKISNEERQKLKDYALELYKTKYLGKMFDVLLSYRKSLLTFFSNSVNAGKPRASKMLQSTVSSKVDGLIGKGTISALLKFLDNHEDKELSNGMLSKMASFYCMLVTKRKSRFGRFKHGWFNRLKNLGYTAKFLKKELN